MFAYSREYGWREKFISALPGGNSRLDELQAAILRIKLKHLEASNKRRIQIANLYREEITSAMTHPITRTGNEHVFHLYVVRTKNRDRKRNAMLQSGITAGLHYPMPVHLQPAYKNRIKPRVSLKETEAVAKTILSLPMYPELETNQIESVIRCANEAI